MRKILLSVMMLLAAGMAKADDNDHFTVVVKNGSPVADVKSVSFVQQATGIEAVDMSKAGVVLPTKASATLQLTGLASGSVAKIYSVDGRLVKEATAAGESLTISVADLAEGTYILRTKNTDVKFVKQ